MIAGTFSCKSLKNWNLEISYSVKAYVTEDSDLMDTDTIIVSQPAPAITSSHSQQPKACNTFEFKEFLGLRDAQIVLECWYVAGHNIHNMYLFWYCCNI